MKKLFSSFILIALSFVLVHPQAMAQSDTKDFHFTVKTNPLAALGGPFYVVFVPVTGEYKAVIETKTIDKQSLQIAVSYVGPSVLVNLEKISDTIAAISVGGYRIQAMYKFFITSSDKNLDGFYIAPHFSYASAKIKDKNNPDDFVQPTKLNINGVLGYQIVSDGGFALDIYTGFGFRKVNWSYTSGTEFDTDFTDKSGINVTLGLSFGYAF